MSDPELLLAAIAVAAVACAIGVWKIRSVLEQGFNEHIKVMQAIYENTKREG